MKDDRVLMALKLIADVNEQIKRPAKFKKINLTKLIKNAEQRSKYQQCEVCEIAGKYYSQSTLEKHHISGKFSGKINFENTITVCLQCHEFLSDRQKSWLPNEKEYSKQNFLYFYGWADIFDLLRYRTGLLYFRKLGEKFRSQAYHLRNNFLERKIAR